MTLVYIPGIWDLLHIGHVRVLQRARALGDRLVVGVPTDSVVYQDKGELPVITHWQRLEMVNSLECVDLAMPYDKLDFIPHLDLINPDILAVGQTWGSQKRHLDAEKWVEMNSRRMVKIPYTPLISTSQIKALIQSRINEH